MDRMITKKRALEIIDNFKRARVLVVGDIMVDHFIWGRVTRISPEAPVPVVDVQSDNLLLGGSANVIHNISAMGGKVYGTGVIGDDDIADIVFREFQKKNLDTGGLITQAGRPTTLKTRIVAHGQQVVRFDRESRQPVHTGSIDQIVGYIKKMSRCLDAIVISDYGKGVITGPLLDGIRQIIAGKKIVVCVDPKQSDFSLYQGFDIITPNHHEAARALSIDVRDGYDLVAVGEKLLERYHFRGLLITRGEEGMSLFEKDGRIIHTHFSTRAKEVFDVTGAGDTVIGVFALCMASRASFKEAAFLANNAAGIVVGKVGTATVSQEELKKSL
jgi:D-beta-D-heptose 7-phosphate kinase/D-beta-D-heptose 1-phosphate adenosyltransferase